MELLLLIRTIREPHHVHIKNSFNSITQVTQQIKSLANMLLNWLGSAASTPMNQLAKYFEKKGLIKEKEKENIKQESQSTSLSNICWKQQPAF